MRVGRLFSQGAARYDRHMSEPRGEVEHLRELATSYRRTVGLLAVSWLATAFSSEVPGVLAGPILLAIAVLLAVQGARLARLLGLPLPIGWGVLLFIPLVNLVTLLVLSRKATAYCRVHGVRVGLLGPRLEDLERLSETGLPRAEVR